MTSRAFTVNLADLLQGFGPVGFRRMFSGQGMFHDGLMIAIVIDDVLYLKTDAQTRPVFESLGLTPFEYRRQGRSVALSYWRAPAEVLESPAEAVHWLRLAHGAALRSRPVGAKARSRAPAKRVRGARPRL